ncbi:MAG: family 16 glycosylhydrolase, partial [Spirochaetia bacterium]|nr:family 16 glycosylhydrolase [Spirochaetia bacterium]
RIDENISITVLIPSRNEAGGALKTIQSLLDQDINHPVDIYLILKDDTDSSIPFLRKKYGILQFKNPEINTIFRNKKRSLHLVFAGEDSKSKKINFCIKYIKTPYTGILDADHQADQNWIRNSLALLEENKAEIIQSIRKPLHTAGFFRFWDSIHQHIGCELFSSVFSRLGLTVFFTGSTAVMKTGLLHSHPFTDSITEDTDFSYSLMAKKIRILRNPLSGSYEDVSPNLFSFIARRRRWAGGHTQTFLFHAGRILFSGITMKEKIQFFLHGMHYLSALPVFFLHLLIGILLIERLRSDSIIISAVFSFSFALGISISQKASGWINRMLEIPLLTAWFIPGIVIAINILEAVIMADLSRIFLDIPIGGISAAAGIIIFLSPVTLNLAGMIGFHQFSLSAFLVMIATYPFALYLDITGILLGLTDIAAGNQNWRSVARSDLSGRIHREIIPSYLPDGGHKETWKLLPVQFFISEGEIHFMKHHYKKGIALAAISIFAAAVYISMSDQIELQERSCTLMEHDSHPWIVPPENISHYCSKTPDLSSKKVYSKRTGRYIEEKIDSFQSVDPVFWNRLNSTFQCNLSSFHPENIIMNPGRGISFLLKEGKHNGKNFTSGSLATMENPEAQYLYGRFETELKAVKHPGVITAFFLYRFDPWQEIDMEFVGNDTSKVLINVYYNPGNQGDKYNYGYYGTPVMVDLGFDASEKTHRYAIEWEKNEIRWFADGKLIHRRTSGNPTPVPHLPMRFHASLWPICSEKLAGKFETSGLPVQADIQSISLYRWKESYFNQAIKSLFGSEDKNWRHEAQWIQP